jgi:hypothetical protein
MPHQTQTIMNIPKFALTSVAAVTLAFGSFACTKSEDRPLGEKVDDALDNRPAEKVKDTVEDVTE